MKVVILAGGLGSRLAEETAVRPKPMVEIGGRPILWHIMKIYAAHGLTDFVVCLGYKGHVIKQYFADFFLQSSDVTFDLSTNAAQVHTSNAEPWRVTLVDTGDHSMTGGRLRRVRDYVAGERFCFTYGDAVADVDLVALLRHHENSGCRATVTAVRPAPRWGTLRMDDAGRVTGFDEKALAEDQWINGGFFVVEPGVIDLIAGDDTHWELEPMTSLASSGHLSAYRHGGFWQAMDTLRDRHHLEALWASGEAPWKVW
jgi:glucose-1-phosphate cytidylyltransferase